MDEHDTFSLLCSHIPVPVWVTADGRYIECNTAAVSFFGCPDRKALIGRKPDEFSPEYQPDGERSDLKAQRLMQATQDSLEQVGFEWTYLRPDGSRVEAIVNLRWITVDGRTALLSTGHDLTEHATHLRTQLRHQAEVILSTGAGTWELDCRSGRMKCNAHWAGILGYTLDELSPITLETCLGLTHPEDLERARLPFSLERLHSQDLFEECLRLRHRNGDWVWMLIRGRVVERDGDGHALRLTGTQQDISDQMQARNALELMSSVYAHTREGVIITDAAGCIVDVNTAFTRITGHARAEVLGLTPSMLQSGQHPPEYFAAMWASLIANGQWHGEIWNRRKDGSLQANIMNISAIRDADGRTTNYIAVFSDITTIKEHQQRLERLAHHDPLTDLPNRTLFADRLQQAMLHTVRRGTLLAVVYMDLDGFKAINDRHGHAAGDQLLGAVARNLKGALREGDTLARLGGDEFVALLVDIEKGTDCDPVVQRLLQAAATPVVLNKAGEVQVSACAGIALYPQDFADPDLLLHHADQAMYRAKESGRNRFQHFRPPYSEREGG